MVNLLDRKESVEYSLIVEERKAYEQLVHYWVNDDDYFIKYVVIFELQMSEISQLYFSDVSRGVSPNKTEFREIRPAYKKDTDFRVFVTALFSGALGDEDDAVEMNAEEE